MKKLFVCTAIASALLLGCEAKKSDAPPTSSKTEHGHDHHHPSSGPHHGMLVELGNEEYHAEIVHDDQSVTVYILDSHAQAAVPVEATEVTINVLHDGTPEQFKLPAAPEPGDGAGKASRFTLADADLASHIDQPAAKPKLSLVIGGKAFSGAVSE